MSVKSEIYTLLSTDSSITALVGSNVYHDILPVNFPTSESSVVYSARIPDPIHTCQVREVMDVWLVTIKAVSSDATDIDPIADAVKSAMHGYSSSVIGDVLFERDMDVYDPDNNLYTLSLDFTVWAYKN